MMKKGNQQKTNAPVMMANVLAAFRSRFESAEFCAFRRVMVDLSGCAAPLANAIELVSAVMGSFSMRSTPLPLLFFSGLVLADDTFVKAVVVSLIVGSGRPMTVITAAAIPPEPPAAEAMSPPETAPDGAPDTFQ